MILRIDEELCTGHGRCYMLAPELFAPDDDGFGRVRVREVSDEARPAAESAAANCPEGAITVEPS